MAKKEEAIYNYIGLISGCCAIILATFFLYESQIEQTNTKNDILEIKRNLLLKSQNITDFTQSAAKIASENYILLKERKMQKSDYFKYLSYDPERHGYHLDRLPELLKVSKVGSLTYLGTPRSLTPEKIVEINMALNLSGLFRMIRENIKDSPWVYYTSNNFIYLTPYLTSLDFFFSFQTLEKEFYRLARPENNPERKPFWTSAYTDEAGKGLMITYSVPVYAANQFKGAISVDVTVDQFNSVLNLSPVSSSGSIYLFNSKGQLLAGKEISSKDGEIHSMKNFFDPSFIEKLASIRSPDEGEFTTIESYYVVKQTLPNLQMTLFYRINRADFWIGILKKVQIFLMLFVIAIVLIIRNLKSIAQVNLQRAALTKSQRLLNESQKIAHLCSWEFNGATNEIVFSENVNLFFPRLRPTDQISFEDIKNWVAPNERFEWAQKLNVCREKNCHIQFEALFNPEFYARTDRDRYISLTVKSNHQSDQEFILTGTIQDITFRKELEKNLEIERAKSIQTSKLAAIGEMSAGVAHEINNPLAIVLSNSNRIRRLVENHPDEKVARSLNNIDSMVNRMAKIVKGLRSFARDAGNDPFQKYLVKDLIEDIASICAERFKANEIKFHTPRDIPEDLSLFCNPTQISQVIINLLMNAFDSVQGLTERWIRIDLEVQAGHVKFIISDSGLGIDSTIADKIFQPFFTTKEIGKGTGIGLSISKGLIESHKGQIYLDQAQPHTTFVIELPSQV